MSDIQKLKDLMAKYKAIKGYDDGGVVSQEDLAPYMPSKQEEESSGFPPGPQRASYIANKKYQAAQSQKGYYDGGVTNQTLGAPIGYPQADKVIPGVGKLSDLQAFSAGMAKQKLENPVMTTTNGPDGLPVDPEDAAERAQTPTVDTSDSAKLVLADKLNQQLQAMKATRQANPGYTKGGMVKGYDDGGITTPDPNSSQMPSELDQILSQTGQNSPDAGNETPLPWGGLDGKALADYIKANPGPTATTGLNPNAKVEASDDEDEDDDADETPIKGPKLASVSKDSGAQLSLPASSDDAKLLDDDNVSPDSKSTVASLLSSLNSGSSAKPTDSDPYGDAGLQALKDAQSHDKLVGGIAGILGGQAAHDAVNQNGQVSKIMQQRAVQDQSTQHAVALMQLSDEQDKSDPTKPVSVMAQNAMASMYKQLGWEVPPGLNKVSASSIEKSPVWKAIETSETGKLRQQTAEQNFLLRQQGMDKKQTNKQTTDDSKEGAAIGKSLNSLSATSRSALGTAAKSKVSVQRLKDIVTDPDATNEDMHSAAADLDALISGANATQGGTQNVVYHTLANDFAKNWQYITRNPTAPDIPKIKQHIANLADRMNNISDRVINKNTAIIKASHSPWISRNQEQWQNIVNSLTEEPSSNTRTPQSTQLTSQDKQAIDWANSNKTDPRAQQILKLHGLQ